MTGGGARVALALMNVRVAFDGERGTSTVLAVARGEAPPPFAARIQYNGTGVLKGRWEVLMPGDVEPTEDDLLTEATLPVERRALQRRYTLLDRFEIFLPPTGEAVIPGVDPKRLPHLADGAYKVLLRIEASDDKEADSNTGGGRIAHAGGVAGFPMPVLRYFVGSGESLAALAVDPRALQLIAPAHDQRLGAGDALVFAWVQTEPTPLARLEVEVDGKVAYSALVKAGTGSYAAPPFVRQQLAGKRARWRVVALDARGEPAARSEWRAFAVE
jgi:hypothetical protein